MPVFLYYQRWRLRFSCRGIGRAIGLNIFPYCAFAVQFSRIGRGGRKESRRTFTRTCSVFSIHDSRSGERMREKYFLRFHVSVLIDGWVGGKESQRLSTTSGGAFSIHAAGSGMRARGTFEPFAYSSLKFHGLGAEEERSAGGS